MINPTTPDILDFRQYLSRLRSLSMSLVACSGYGDSPATPYLCLTSADRWAALDGPIHKISQTSLESGAFYVRGTRGRGQVNRHILVIGLCIPGGWPREKELWVRLAQ
jgi:hypothetical protein